MALYLLGLVELFMIFGVHKKNFNGREPAVELGALNHEGSGLVHLATGRTLGRDGGIGRIVDNGSCLDHR